jgi:hypothetical protein
LKLAQISKTLLAEGGNMFPEAGKIHISELRPTLAKIAEVTGISDIENKVLGSVGKKEYSGDIDISVSLGSKEEVDAFVNNLKSVVGQHNVKKSGTMIFTVFPIQGYDNTKIDESPRTGLVQVDFMEGNPDYMKFYYHSPHQKDSKLKGAHRNLLIAAISVYADRKESSQTDDDGKPAKVTRWKFGPKGLMRVERTRQKDKKGNWIKKPNDVPLTDYLTSPQEIAAALFRRKHGPEVFDSAETIIDAIKDTFPAPVAEHIFKQAAYNFTDAKLTDFDFPEEIDKYMDAKQ